MPDQAHAIGLVAIGRNEGERLKRCLRSIPSHIPVVYVDSASSDDSVEFARSTNATAVQLDMSRPFSAARARNEGLEALLQIAPNIDYVQFVDGDCELESDWLVTAANFLAADISVAAVCGRRRERFPDASFYNQMCDQEWNTPVGPADACGGDAMICVKAFQEAGGYDRSLIAGEEPELCQRFRAAGRQIWRLDVPMTIHDADMHRFDQWWNRAVRSGFGYAQVYGKTMASGGDPLYGREVGSALFWTAGVIIIALCLAVLWGAIWLAVAPVIWLAQFMRLSSRYGSPKAFHLLIGKVAECVGILRYVLARLRGHKQSAIFYK